MVSVASEPERGVTASGSAGPGRPTLSSRPSFDTEVILPECTEDLQATVNENFSPLPAGGSELRPVDQ